MTRTQYFCEKYNLPWQTVNKFTHSLNLPVRTNKGVRYYSENDVKKISMAIERAKEKSQDSRDELIEAVVIYLKNKMNLGIDEIQRRINNTFEENFSKKQILWTINN